LCDWLLDKKKKKKKKKLYSKESLKGIVRRFYGLQEKGEGVMTMQFIFHKRENTMNHEWMIWTPYLDKCHRQNLQPKKNGVKLFLEIITLIIVQFTS